MSVCEAFFCARACASACDCLWRYVCVHDYQIAFQLASQRVRMCVCARCAYVYVHTVGVRAVRLAMVIAIGRIIICRVGANSAHTLRGTARSAGSLCRPVLLAKNQKTQLVTGI